LTRLAHIQAMHVEFLPLALLAFDRLLGDARARHALALAGWAVLQALCSGYLLVMTAMSLVLAGLMRPTEWLKRDRARTAVLMGAAALLAGIVLTPFLWPYYRASQEQGLVRTLDEAALYSATLSSYVSTGGRLHYLLWSRPFFSDESLFPGIVGLGLTVVALAFRVTFRDRRARMLLAIGVAGVVLSFGPRVPIYGWLYEAFPLLRGIRGASRLGYLGLFAVAGLAGFGLAEIRRRVRPYGSDAAPRHRLAVLVGLSAVFVANVEALRAPMEWTPPLRIAPLYSLLAADGVGAVVEVPFPPPRRVVRNGPYVLASTRHFRPLVNGYSGFTPESYVRHAEQLADFPDDGSRALFHTLGVTHIVVHTGIDPDLRSKAAATPWLESIAVGSSIEIFAVRRER
jgi:hypothetical protein